MITPNPNPSLYLVQQNLDELCLETQYALTVLIDDYIDQSGREDIFLKRRTAQILELNNLMRSVQNYNLTLWRDLTQDDIEKIKEKIVFRSEWRD